MTLIKIKPSVVRTCLVLVASAFICLNSGCSLHKKQQNKEKRTAAKLHLAEVYLSQQNYTSALKELLDAEKLSPDNVMIHHYLGDVYIAKKRYDLSVKQYKKAIHLKPDFTPSVNSLGIAYLRLEEWDKAIETFKQITGNLLYATPHYPLGNIGWAYYNKQDYASAEVYYKKALEFNPKFIVALRGLGRTYQKENKISDAIDVYKKAVEIDPNSALLYMELGDLYLIHQNFREAVKAFEIVKTVSTEDEKEFSDEAEQKIVHIKKAYY